MPKIKDVTARGGLGSKAKEASARATFENEDVRITPSASYSSSKSNKKYNDDVSVDTSSKQSNVGIDGEVRVNKDVDVRAGLGRSAYSMDEKASRRGKDIGGYSEDSSSVRKSLGGRYKDLNIDYSENKPSRGDTYKKLEGSYNIKNDEDEQLSVSGSTDSQKKSKVGIDYTLRFADGGVVPETERMLADGGVMQEGGTVDEVSGNEVPAGSLKEEVRDDVDAKLSPGEFVVPADVVRYIGLENLMKMRDKAKAGLKQMSDIGQMGNAEEAVKDEEDIGEFSSAVDDVMGEEDEDTTFSSAVDETMNEEDGVKKMAKGGYVQAENAATYANAPLKGFEMVSLVNDAGTVVYIPYINGKPQLSIPAGYKVKTSAITPEAAAATPATPAATAATASTAAALPTYSGSGSSRSDPFTGSPYSPTPTKEPSPEDSGYTIDKYGVAKAIPVDKTLSSGLGFGLGVVGIPFASWLAKLTSAGINMTREEAAKAYNEMVNSSLMNPSGPFATTGEEGTGAASASIGRTIADRLKMAGVDDSIIGETTQSAVDKIIAGNDKASAFTTAAVILGEKTNRSYSEALDILTGKSADVTTTPVYVPSATGVDLSPLAPEQTTPINNPSAYVAPSSSGGVSSYGSGSIGSQNSTGSSSAFSGGFGSGESTTTTTSYNNPSAYSSDSDSDSSSSGY